MPPSPTTATRPHGRAIASARTRASALPEHSITAIEDRQVAEAVSFIRKHACERIQAKDVARAIDRSRTTLYRLFQNALGRSPNDEILRVQLERAKALLAQTSHTLEEISQMTGFSRASYFSVAFKREVGMTAGEYRAIYRPKE